MNMKKFDKINIKPYEIIVIVIFDGLDKINNSKDPQTSMLKFFEEQDLRIGLKV